MGSPVPRALSRGRARTRRTAAVGRGILLSTGRQATAVSWARRGMGEVTIAPVDGWTIIAPTGPARVRYPYDDAVRTLAGRPVGRRMRPALGFFKVGSQAVITVHPPGWRSEIRWLIWAPRLGIVPPEGLPEAPIADIVVVAGLDIEVQTRAAHRMRALLEAGEGSAESTLTEVLDILALPGGELLTEVLDIRVLPEARVVPPKPKYAREFERLLDELARERAEQET